MIKIAKNIYIHPLTIFMFASAYITRRLELMSMLYFVMFVHEMAHMSSAIFLRLGVSKIIFYPFGVCLMLKTRILCSFSDKIILYLSGPFVNAAIAVIMLIFGKVNDFYYNNLALFLLNLLPILPLDGGKLLEEILLYKKGEKYTRKMMLIISVSLSAFLIVILMIFALPTVNSVTFAVFLLGNSLLQKPKYRRDYLRQLAVSLPDTDKANVIITEKESVSENELIKEFSASKRTLVVFCNDKGEVEGVKTDKELIHNVLS